MEHWLEWEIAQWVHPMKDRSDDPLHHERTLWPWSYISLPLIGMDLKRSIFISQNGPTGYIKRRQKRKNFVYLTTHSTHLIYGYMASDHSVREETHCRHMGYSFRLAARFLLYASSHRQDNTYQSLCYTSRGSLVGARNSSMGPPWRIDPMTHRTMSECSYQWATSRVYIKRN